MNMPILSRKKLVVLAIMLLIAGMHILGPLRQSPDPWHDWYYSYFSDLSLPFGFYFLLCMTEANFPPLRPWWLKAGLVFGAATMAEILQFFGIDTLGVTFDPLDIVMYACGTLLAVVLERGIFNRWLSFWTA
jgi:hypothetical protein